MFANNKLNVKFLTSWLILFFFILIPISTYFHLQPVVVSIYILLSLIFCLFKNKINFHLDFKSNYVFYLWIIYILISILSTIVFKRFSTNDLSGIYAEISFTFIIFILTRFWDPIYFLKIFRNLLIFLSVIAILGEILRIDPFSALKQGTQFTSIDTTTNGAISTIFEYRHYYALFLISAMICLWEFPIKSKIIGFFCNLILFVNIILTNTRNAWLAFIIVLIIWLMKERPFRISQTRIIYSFIIIIILILLFALFSNVVTDLLSVVNSRIMDLIDSQDKYGGATGVRGYTLQYGTKYILDNWQKYLLIGGGNGFALEWLFYNPFGLTTSWRNAVDVQYVTTFMNTGILGLITLLGILLKNVEYFIKSNTPEGKTFTLIILGMGIMISFFDVIPFNNSPFVFWIICLCGLNTISFTKGKREYEN